MAGESIAEISVILSTDSTKFKKGMKDAGKEVDDFRRKSNKMGEDIEKVSGFSTSFGIALISVSEAAKASGYNLGGMENTLTAVGFGMTALGASAQLAGKAIKAFAVIATTEFMPAISAMYAAVGPVGWLIIGIGLLAGAYFLLSQKAGPATQAVKDSGQAAEEAKTKWEKLTGAIKDYYGYSEDLEDLAREQSRTLLDIADAQDELNNLTPGTREYARASLNLGSLVDKYDDLSKKINETGEAQQKTKGAVPGLQEEYGMAALLAAARGKPGLTTPASYQDNRAFNITVNVTTADQAAQAVNAFTEEYNLSGNLSAARKASGVPTRP